MPMICTPRRASHHMSHHASRPGRLAAALLLCAASVTAASADDASSVDPTNVDRTSVDPTVTASTTGTASSGSVEFSPALSGTWTARGDVLPNLDMDRPFRVSCEFEVEADDTSFDLAGECGALFIKRPLRTSLTREEGAIRGTYDADLRSGVAQLEGQDTDEGIALDIEWGDEVNGDRAATMRLVREDEKLRIVTVDRDLETGEEVTTSDLLLERG